MVSAPPKTGRWARLAAMCLVLLVALGVCTLRLVGIRSERDAKSAEAVHALSEALERSGEERREALQLAKKAAVQATRVSAALLDPYPAFLLSTVEEIDSFDPGEPQTETARSAYEAALQQVAQNELDAAQATLEAEISSRTPDDPDLDRVRFLLRLVVELCEDRADGP
ncbi:MAG: hypothetical protein AUK47_21730 [Deltaproteobacteria bacterium CG2_30_63_29]|nr:MAG: hypothetical protein AUK47_21730 [Deltaproteobacteria bacterium CG2_30_63_29]PJB46593.1 MAG: hypothetical protein CO108_05660 [Deltaproteobacteria bacterium CG_4_9_14_3_um_filter_63_12]